MASEGEIILDYQNTLIRKSDFASLNSGQWLNDNIISFWFEYLENVLYADYAQKVCFISPQVSQLIKSAAEYSTQQEDVRIMLESMNLKNRDLILLPISDCPTNSRSTGGSHWSLLAFVNSNRTFEHYDSFQGSVNHLHAQSVFSVLHNILISNREASLDLDFVEMACRQQTNSYDCGIHLLLNAEALCKRVFKKDYRKLFDIVTPSAISQARDNIKELIMKMRND